MSGESESKVLYLEGDALRVFRGIIVAEDDYFVTLERTDGVVRISKLHIVKIENRRSVTNG